MRWTSVLQGAPKQTSVRRPQVEPIPFQELLPLKLRKYVSGKHEKSSDPVCLQEMAMMFSCFKKTDFDQIACEKEIKSFSKCYADYEVSSEVMKQHIKKGTLIPGEKKLTHKQVNKLLSAFPPPKQKQNFA